LVPLKKVILNNTRLQSKAKYTIRLLSKAKVDSQKERLKVEAMLGIIRYQYEETVHQGFLLKSMNRACIAGAQYTIQHAKESI
jgi:hypothetical protein